MARALSKIWQGSRRRKLALILVLALLLFELAYLIAINVLLRNGQLARWMNQASEDVHLEIDSGWSIWPGRVHAGEVRFRFEDRNVQFFVTVDDAVVDISVWKLPSKVIHLSRIRGDGTRYLFRHKVKSAAGLQRRLARYPEIPGFSDPPLVTEAAKPPLSDEEYNLWTVQLSNVDVQVNELWFQEYRFVGKGRARGAFRLKPQRAAQTERCQLDLIGKLSSGPQPVVDDLVGKLEVELHRFDPREVKGDQVFGKFTVHADMGGALPNLNVSELYTKPEGLQLGRGAGRLAVKLDYEHGEWVKGSSIRYNTDGLTLKQKELAITARGDLAAEIVEGGPNARVQLSFSSPSVRLGHRAVPDGFEDPVARQVHVALSATADLTRPKSLTGLSADLHPVLPDVRWLNHALRKPDLFSSGRAEATVQADWSAPATGQAKVRVSMEDVALKADKKPVQLSGKLDVHADYDPKRERGLIRLLDLRLPEVRIGDAVLPGGVQIRGERVELQGRPPNRSEARFVVTMANAQPLLPLAIPSDILRALADILVDLGNTRATFEFDHTKAVTELRMVQAKSGNVVAVGRLRKDKGTPHACSRWYIQAGPARAGVVTGGGKNSVKPMVSPAWWRERPRISRCAATR